MSDIDWSKAPEGATHYDPISYYYPWEKHEGGNCYFFSVRASKWILFGAKVTEEYISHKIPRPLPWQGPQDGLPPVGTVCEVCPDGGENWHECEILAIHNGAAVYFSEDAEYQYDAMGMPECFRPLQEKKE